MKLFFTAVVKKNARRAKIELIARIVSRTDQKFWVRIPIPRFCFVFSGYIAERVNLRYFLSLGMIFAGIFTFLFGLAKYVNVHSIGFFIVVQVGRSGSTAVVVMMRGVEWRRVKDVQLFVAKDTLQEVNQKILIFLTAMQSKI